MVEHLVHIREVFIRLQGAGLTAKPFNCHFRMFECTYLGHVAGKGIVQLEPSKVQAVMSFPIPILPQSGLRETVNFVLQTDASNCGVGAVLS